MDSSLHFFPIDPEECYADPSDRLSPNHGLSKDDLEENNLPVANTPIEQTTNSTTRYHPHVYGGQDGSNTPVNRSNRTSKLNKRLFYISIEMY